MSYTRPPNTILAGTALKQAPQPTPLSPAGLLPETISANIATTSSLGVIQVGSNLSITPAGLLSATTPIGIPGYYGAFLDTTIQTNPVVDQVNIMRLNTTVEANGVSVVNDTEITVANSGVYNLQFSVQLAKTTGADRNVDIWFRKNGIDISNSNTQLTLFGSDSRLVAAWNFVSTLLAGEYLEIAWSSPFSTMELLAIPPQINPDRPEVPSVIVTLTQVSAI